MEYEVAGPRPRGRPKRTWRQVVEKNCQARKLNTEDATDHSRQRKLIKDVWWSGWVWVGECLFWYGLPGSPGPKGRETVVCVCVFGWQLPSKWCGAVLLLLLADAADTEVFIVHITRDVLQIMQVCAAVQHIQHWHTLKYCHTRDTHVKAAKNYYTRAYLITPLFHSTISALFSGESELVHFSSSSKEEIFRTECANVHRETTVNTWINTADLL